MPRHATETAPPIEWRRLGPYLWAGVTERGHIGTIERGRRYAAVDADGRLRGRCRSLADAQALLAHVDQQRLTEATPRRAA